MSQEMKNCLEEARAACAAIEPEIHGSGPIKVTVREPYHCRSTDAFAGLALRAIHYFEDRDDALDLCYRLTNDDPELYVTLHEDPEDESGYPLVPNDEHDDEYPF